MKITLCRCAHRDLFDLNTITNLMSALEKSEHEIRMVDDLCWIAAVDPDQFADIARHSVIACHPRVFQSFCSWRGVSPQGEYFNLRASSFTSILQSMGVNEAPEQSISLTTPSTPDWEAWYPLIDRDRCTDCGKCFDFCLFGVYTITDGVVHVTNPSHCKNNCPACARNCPSSAIIFPKYPKSPVNGGLELEEEVVVGREFMLNQSLRDRLEKRRQIGRKILK